MLVIGIDPATNTGICEGLVGQTPTLLAHRFRKSKRDEPEDIFRHAASFFLDFLSTRSPYAIAIEAPVRVKRNGETHDKTTTITRGLYGIFTGIAGARGTKVIPAEIKTWRAYAIDNGNADGATAKRLAVLRCHQFGWPAPTHDSAEAAMIWLWACGQLSSPLFGRVA